MKYYVVNRDKYIVANDINWNVAALKDYILSGDAAWWDPEIVHKGEDEDKGWREFWRVRDECHTRKCGDTLEFQWCSLIKEEDGKPTELLALHVKDLALEESFRPLFE